MKAPFRESILLFFALITKEAFAKNGGKGGTVATVAPIFSTENDATTVAPQSDIGSSPQEKLTKEGTKTKGKGETSESVTSSNQEESEKNTDLTKANTGKKKKEESTVATAETSELTLEDGTEAPSKDKEGKEKKGSTTDDEGTATEKGKEGGIQKENKAKGSTNNEKEEDATGADKEKTTSELAPEDGTESPTKDKEGKEKKGTKSDNEETAKKRGKEDDTQKEKSAKDSSNEEKGTDAQSVDKEKMTSEHAPEAETESTTKDQNGKDEKGTTTEDEETVTKKGKEGGTQKEKPSKGATKKEKGEDVKGADKEKTKKGKGYNGNQADGQLTKCNDFLLSEKKVGRDEFMTFIIEEASLDVIQKQNSTWDVSDLSKRLIDEDGKLFGNASTTMPEYTILPPDLITVFVDKACDYQSRARRVSKYCRTEPRNLTAIPKDASIRLEYIDSESKKQEVVSEICTESMNQWSKVVGTLLEFYKQNSLIHTYPTSSPTPAPTNNPTPSPTKSPTKQPTESPTASPTSPPSRELLSVDVPPFMVSVNVDSNKEVDKKELLQNTKSVLSDKLKFSTRPAQEFVRLNLSILTQETERRSRLLRDQQEFVATIGGTAYFHGSAPNEAEMKSAIQEALTSKSYITTLQSSENAAIRDVKIDFEGEEKSKTDVGDVVYSTIESPEPKKKIAATVCGIVGGIVLLVVAALLCFYSRTCSSAKTTDAPPKENPNFEGKKEEGVGAKDAKQKDEDFGEEIPL